MKELKLSDIKKLFTLNSDNPLENMVFIIKTMSSISDELENLSSNKNKRNLKQITSWIVDIFNSEVIKAKMQPGIDGKKISEYIKSKLSCSDTIRFIESENRVTQLKHELISTNTLPINHATKHSKRRKFIINKI